MYKSSGREKCLKRTARKDIHFTRTHHSVADLPREGYQVTKSGFGVSVRPHLQVFAHLSIPVFRVHKSQNLSIHTKWHLCGPLGYCADD